MKCDLHRAASAVLATVARNQVFDEPERRALAGTTSLVCVCSTRILATSNCKCRSWLNKHARFPSRLRSFFSSPLFASRANLTRRDKRIGGTQVEKPSIGGSFFF